MTIINFAIVGLGYGGTRCQMLAATPGARLSAVVDRNEERARAFGERYEVPWFTSHKALLDSGDVDVVAIYTPSGLHLDMALDVIGAGKHLLLTKPMEVTIRRCDTIIGAAAANNVQLFSEFYLRYYRDNVRARRAIDAGQLGRLILGEFGFKCYRPQAYYLSDGGWRQTVEMNGGGIVMNQALHAIDQMTWLMGPPESVVAQAGTYGLDIPVEDTAIAQFRMRSGAVATLATTSTFRTTHGVDDMYGGGFTTRAELNGNLGSVTILENEFSMVKLERGEIADAEDAPANVFEDIVLALSDPGYRSVSLSRGIEGRLCVDVAQAIYESARTGMRVEIAALPDLPSNTP